MSVKFEDVSLVLASASPRRLELLSALGWRFDVVPADVDESVFSGESPDALVERLSEAKAGFVAKNRPGSLVMAADTVVAVDGRIFGKPLDRDESVFMLSALSGRTHQVFTGVSVFYDGRVITRHERTDVTFRMLLAGEIEAYIDCVPCSDKAGSYAIQGRGALLVESVVGDYYNVVGMPICLLGKILNDLGFPLSDLWSDDDE